MSTDQDYIRGRTVSVDVSTGDHDAGHRIFGTVIGVENGVILCEMTEENQDAGCKPSVTDALADIVMMLAEDADEAPDLTIREWVEEGPFADFFKPYREARRKHGGRHES